MNIKRGCFLEKLFRLRTFNSDVQRLELPENSVYIVLFLENKNN